MKSECETYFTRSQIAIVKEAEHLILEDLSKRFTAKEMANRFGISESSFKLYIKGILGDSYLSYFRKKRMEKAAELLESTNMKVTTSPSVSAMRIRESSPKYFPICTAFLPWNLEGFPNKKVHVSHPAIYMHFLFIFVTF